MTSSAAECPGCGLFVADLDDVTEVDGRRYHVACADDGGVVVSPVEQASRRRRFNLLVASRIAAGRYLLSGPPLPPE